MDFDRDRIRSILESGLHRPVALFEADKFIKEGGDYMMTYDDVVTNIYEHYNFYDVPLDVIPSLLFRTDYVCITPKAKLEDCLFITFEEIYLSQTEIEGLIE